ncbi:unnamed protein product [Vitrella brassicaformis CCMP3155]|uniref:Secreted protein n=1 Tax=Vitrella brassicaformis (strain CCMP3155) TaxID=1169540 RepID=A0A0G4GPX4_VITBC|nr:unnamed protein product [Vitrella brassicaformis CCMP3155]|mmetsp:Transcript_50715/g.127227  ORF Transcript_50715/g.127227 Transcript_50715/m.127227 type:complete len:81 (-) Transcript_50715:259-501(-)|eukprot:CEM32413.1 unnamed protein product [Vitrella brassicaformis CCMP3155]
MLEKVIWMDVALALPLSMATMTHLIDHYVLSTLCPFWIGSDRSAPETLTARNCRRLCLCLHGDGQIGEIGRLARTHVSAC